ncbi:hypothetical protein RB199_07720 [Streptomyces libani]|nr:MULTISPECIES: hypothetical protein [Streptomyces]MCX5450134.1 hypothetical protein [Streptomyces libani]WDT59236.1 hypothetical protein NUT86_37305 [Streptomyces sp. G7(2002)]
MAELINSRYAALVAAYREAQKEDPEETAPVRGFVFPDAESRKAE